MNEELLSEMHLEMSFVKWQAFRLGLNVLKVCVCENKHMYHVQLNRGFSWLNISM